MVGQQSYKVVERVEEAKHRIKWLDENKAYLVSALAAFDYDKQLYETQIDQLNLEIESLRDRIDEDDKAFDEVRLQKDKDLREFETLIVEARKEPVMANIIFRGFEQYKLDRETDKEQWQDVISTLESLEERVISHEEEVGKNVVISLTEKVDKVVYQLREITLSNLENLDKARTFEAEEIQRNLSELLKDVGGKLNTFDAAEDLHKEQVAIATKSAEKAARKLATERTATTELKEKQLKLERRLERKIASAEKGKERLAVKEKEIALQSERHEAAMQLQAKQYAETIACMIEQHDTRVAALNSRSCTMYVKHRLLENTVKASFLAIHQTTETLQATIDKLAADLRQRDADLEQRDADAVVLQGQMSRMRQVATERQERLDEYRVSTHKKKSKWQKMQTSQRQFVAELLESKNTDKASYKESALRLQEALNTSELKVQYLEQKNTESQQMLEEKQSALSQISARLEASEDQTDKFATAKDLAETKAKKQLESFTNELSKLQQAKEAAQAQAEQQLTASKTGFDELQQAKTSAQTEAENQLHSLRTALNKLQQVKEDAQASANEQLSTLKTQCQGLQQASIDARKEKEEAHAQASLEQDTLRAQVGRLQTARNQAQADVLARDNEIAEMQTKMRLQETRNLCDRELRDATIAALDSRTSEKANRDTIIVMLQREKGFLAHTLSEVKKLQLRMLSSIVEISQTIPMPTRPVGSHGSHHPLRRISTVMQQISDWKANIHAQAGQAAADSARQLQNVENEKETEKAQHAQANRELERLRTELGRIIAKAECTKTSAASAIQGTVQRLIDQRHKSAKTSTLATAVLVLWDVQLDKTTQLSCQVDSKKAKIQAIITSAKMAIGSMKDQLIDARKELSKVSTLTLGLSTVLDAQSKSKDVAIGMLWAKVDNLEAELTMTRDNLHEAKEDLVQSEARHRSSVRQNLCALSVGILPKGLTLIDENIIDTYLRVGNQSIEAQSVQEDDDTVVYGHWYGGPANDMLSHWLACQLDVPGNLLFLIEIVKEGCTDRLAATIPWLMESCSCLLQGRQETGRNALLMAIGFQHLMLLRRLSQKISPCSSVLETFCEKLASEMMTLRDLERSPLLWALRDMACGPIKSERGYACGTTAVQHATDLGTQLTDRAAQAGYLFLDKTNSHLQDCVLLRDPSTNLYALFFGVDKPHETAVIFEEKDIDHIFWGENLSISLHFKQVAYLSPDRRNLWLQREMLPIKSIIKNLLIVFATPSEFRTRRPPALLVPAQFASR
ncbi:hypothetical protein MMC13_005710 [Lambiella insularis]|nr:hypothetical protein [Lambiella insularis]